MKWIQALFKKQHKKKLTTNTIPLDGGIKVNTYQLSNWMVRDAEQRATMADGILNNAVYFAIIEDHILNLTKDEIDNLKPSDSNKIRAYVKNMLEKEGIIEPEKKTTQANSDFDPEEVAWFEKTRAETEQRLKGGVQHGGRK